MVAGLLNPSDNTRATGVRPARTMSGAASRRWFSDGLNTQVRDHDLNDLLAQIRVACDFYGVVDAEGDDNALQKAIAAAVGVLTGNIKQFQLLVGAADKVPYFTSAAAMSTFTTTSFSRTLLAKTTAVQWLDALGVSASSSPNVVAFGALTAAANQIAYFTGAGAMALTNLSVFMRTVLDDLDAAAARTTLGLGTAATQPTTAFATSADLALKANLVSPIFTGVPVAPTAAAATSTTQIATTQFVQAAIATVPIASISGLQAVLDSKAPLASPAFSGSPTAPTQVKTDNTTKLATDQFVHYHVTDINAALALKADSTAVALKANIASPAFTGAPTAPTPSPAENSTVIATTAYVQDAIDVVTGGSGTSAAYDIGTTGATIPLNNGANAMTGMVSLSFSAALGDKIALYSALGGAGSFALGVESNTMFFRSGAIYRWYINKVSDLGVGDHMQLATTGLTVNSFDDAATGGPYLDLHRDSPGAAANDLISYVRFLGNDSMGNLTAYGQIYGQILDPLDGSEDGRLVFNILTGGAGQTRMFMGAGIYGPSSTDMGINTLNYVTLYENNVSLATKYATIASPTFNTMVTVDAGPLIISRVGDAATAQIQIRGDAGWSKGVYFLTGTTYRWDIRCSNGAESGGNAGSDLEVYCYNDAGSAIGGPTLSIARTTRIAAFAVSPTAPTPAANDNTTKLATTAYVQTELAGYAALVGATFTGAVTATALTANAGTIQLNRVGDAALASLLIDRDAGYEANIYFRTGVAGRWKLLATNDAEAGSNAGSDFVINRYADAGSVIGAVLTITRSTGIAAFAVTPTAPTMATADSSTSLATTAYVKNNLASYLTTASAAATYATMVNPDFIGAAATFTAMNVDITDGLLTLTRTDGAAAYMVIRTTTQSSSLYLDTDAGHLRSIWARTGTTNRWRIDLANADAESGSSAGSNLAIHRFNDAGALLGTSFTIERATGLTTINGELLATGGPMTFDRTAATVTTTFSISGAAGFVKEVMIRTGANARWSLRANATGETGANLGSNFALTSFDDAGSSIGSVFTVARSTRVLTFSVIPTSVTPAANDNSTQLATTAFVMAQDGIANTAMLSNATNWAVSQNFYQGSTHGGVVSAGRKATFDTSGNLTLNNTNGGTVVPLVLLNGTVAIGTGVCIDFKMGASLLAGRIYVTSLGDYSAAAEADSRVYLQYATNGALANAFSVDATSFTFIHTNVVATTPLTADNSTKVATTAFVKAQGYTLLREVEEVVDAKTKALNDNIAALNDNVALLKGQVATLSAQLATK